MTVRRFRRVQQVCVVLAVFSFVSVSRPSSSLAQDAGDAAALEPSDAANEQARAFFEAGREAYQAARFDEALAAFQRAHALMPLPDFQFNIGLTHERLGDDEAAIEAFEAFLASEPDAEQAESLERRLVVLRRRIAARTPHGAELERRAEEPERDVVVSSGPTAAAVVLLASGGVLLAGGAVTLAIGAVDRDQVVHAADGELEWRDAQSRLAVDDALVVAGSVGLVAGAALALIAIPLWSSEEGVRVSASARGVTLEGRW